MRATVPASKVRFSTGDAGAWGPRDRGGVSLERGARVSVGNWNVDGVFVGSVEGEPVNCRLRLRILEHGTEVWIKAIGVNRESITSRAPEVRQFIEHAIREFHCAAQDARCAANLEPPTIAAPRLTLFPADRVRDRPDPATYEAPSASGRPAQQSG